jgi:hypothetical protein
MKMKLTSLMLMVVAMVALGARTGAADTITVKTLNVNAATGTFQYTVTLDDTTFIAPGDGFVIYDFGGFTGSATLSSLTGGGTLAISNTNGLSVSSISQGNTLPSPAGVNGDATAAAMVDIPSAFIYTSTNTGNSAGLGTTTFDNPGTSNLVFTENGAGYTDTSDTQTYLLTLTTTLTNTMNKISQSMFAEEDEDTSNSDSASFSQNLVDVPLGSNNITTTFAPLPKSFPAGLALFGLAGLVGWTQSKRTAKA